MNVSGLGAILETDPDAAVHLATALWFIHLDDVAVETVLGEIGAVAVILAKPPNSRRN
jgi:hypothetical protein